MKYSIIIPVLKIQKSLNELITFLNETLTTFEYEIIIVSHSENCKINLAGNIKVFNNDVKTISSSRNLGVEKASGDYIIFIDSDIELAKSWAQDIDSLIKINKFDILQPTIIPKVESSDRFIDEYRYRTRSVQTDGTFNHIIAALKKGEAATFNTAFLIVKKDFFCKCGGFNSELSSFEGFDLFKKALKHNAHIVPSLKIRALVRWDKGKLTSLSYFFYRVKKAKDLFKLSSFYPEVDVNVKYFLDYNGYSIKQIPYHFILNISFYAFYRTISIIKM